MEPRIFAIRFVVFSLFAMAALVGPGFGRGGVEGYSGRAERESGGVEGERGGGVEGEVLKSSAPKIVWRRPKDLTEDFLRANQKPVLMLVHKSWCAVCARLWSHLAGGEGEEGREELERLANHFVLVNAADADEPMERQFAPDGGYIPRLLFLSPNGTVRPDVKCSLNPTPDFFYFYNSVSQVVRSMKTMLSIFPKMEEK